MLALLSGSIVVTAAPLIKPLKELPPEHEDWDLQGWEPTPAGLIIIQRTDEQGNKVKVVYHSKMVHCRMQAPAPADFIPMSVVSEGSPPACYLISPGPIGYLENGQLMPFIEKTWPPKKPHATKPWRKGD